MGPVELEPTNGVDWLSNLSVCFNYSYTVLRQSLERSVALRIAFICNGFLRRTNYAISLLTSHRHAPIRSEKVALTMSLPFVLFSLSLIIEVRG